MLTFKTNEIGTCSVIKLIDSLTYIFYRSLSKFDFAISIYIEPRPGCSFIQSDKALYCWLANFEFSSWYPQKLVMDCSKNGNRTRSFKKFSRLMVKVIIK
jgi:hypothetical protein